MTIVTDPKSGLQLVELSHVWDHGVPSLPGNADVKMFRSVKHAQHGVMAHRIKMVLHTGTHMNAPIHLVQRGSDMAGVSVDRFFGNGVVLNIPKKRWELITTNDLAEARPAIQEGDIVVIVTGWHQKYSDSLEYFGESPGLSKEGAEWLVEKGCKMLAMDTPQIDHPLATSLANHRNGPTMKRLVESYQNITGLDPVKEHPEWNIAHKTLLEAGIVTIEQVGGDVNTLLEKRATLAATPWKWEHGDACPVRLIAMVDPTGNCRIESGE
jgi:kynurenine formamidase